MDDRERDMWGPGIVLQPDNFGGQWEDMPVGEDRFAERQDAVHRLNIGLAGADADANELLSIVPTSDDYDFSAEMEKLFRKRSNETLKDLRHPADRDEAIQDFDGLMRRYMGRAWEMSLDSRVRSRAAGAEQALGRIRAAAVADPDGLYDRLSDANMLLGRMIETGVDANAAATRAGQFRGEVGTAILDDLAERDPRGAISRLDDGFFNGLLSADEKMPIRDDFIRLAEADDHARQRRAHIAERAVRFETAARRRSAVGALSAALQSGEADDGHIARAVYSGEIDEDDASDLRGRLELFDADRRRKSEEIDHLDTAVKSGLAARYNQSFSQAWSQETIDAWWQGERNRGTALSELIPDCFGVTGCIPQPYTDDMRARLLSGLPDDTVAAAQDFRSLRERSGAAADAVLANMPEDEANRLASVAQYAHLNLPAFRITELGEAEYERRQTAATKPRNADMRMGRGASADSIGDVDAPTMEPVDLEEWYGKLGYSEDGNSEFWNATGISPLKWFGLDDLRDEALERANRVQKENGLTVMEKDAFRHAYWSYKLSEMLGADAAKRIGDAHERKSLQMEKYDVLNPDGERLMDLYNNHVGRQLYQETRGKTDIDIDRLILDVLKSGRLQRDPFNVKRRNQ